LPHPLVLKKDMVYQKNLLRIVPGESFALKVNSDDNIDNFLTLIDISQSRK
jgi:hypothetical protein